ncbi:hypothetical protein EMIT0P100_30330 [Pseudomonas sp. IT-P100]
MKPSTLPLKPNADHLSAGSTQLWRGDLSPFGCEAVANPDNSIYLAGRWGRFATQRGGATFR